jgi:hypothetical protein
VKDQYGNVIAEKPQLAILTQYLDTGAASQAADGWM